MNSSFTLTKLDNVKIILKNYKPQIKKMIDFILNLDEIKKSKVFDYDISKVRFDVSFCNDKTIQKINNDYRNKNCPTDVITFSLFCDDKDSLVYRKTADLGQIIVSVETAYRQSKERKETLEKEILTLICHGILHLFGFDHLEKKDYDFVIRMQEKIIRIL